MDRLKTQNLHYKRVLDRQLSDIETRHRQSEQKRLREVRSLGLDLAKLHRSTRDVDEILGNSTTTSFSIDNTPRTSTPRRASFSSGSSPQTPRPLTSPALTLGRGSSVTSSVAHLLSRSRQELTSVCLASTPRAKSRRHSVFDFRQQQQQQDNRTRKSSLPELKHSNSFDNNINNNNHNSFDNNNNNGTNNSNNDIDDNNYCGLSNNNVCIDNNNIRVVDNVKNKKKQPASTRRRHSTADVSRHVISITIQPLNNNNVNKHTSNSTDNNYNKNNNNSNSNNDKHIINNDNKNSNKRIMTVGEERRGSSNSTTTVSSDIKTLPARRSSLGNLGTTTTTNINKNNNHDAMQDSSKTSSAGISPTRPTGRRRSSTDSNSSSSSPTRLKQSLQKLSITPPKDVSHNETVVLIHRDNDESEVLPTENTSGAGSMFAGTPKRRASEPALGGYLLRNLQNKLRETEKERSTTQSHNGNSGSCIPLKQAIEEELPSGIVAEVDEDRYNEEAEEETKKNGAKSENKNLDKSDGHSSAKPSSSSDMSLSSLSSSSISSMKTPSVKKSSNAKERSGKTRTQARRKSDGDILRFARIWRLHAGNVESLKGLLDDDKEEPIKTPPDTKDDIWDAVRKCRYIRGYDPTDQSMDLRDVFGHQ